jgi:ribosomal protein S18 acetylase RimI-like enzyme
VVVIRRAVLDDADVLADLHVRAWQEAYAGLLPQAYLDGLAADQRATMWRRLLAVGATPCVHVAVDGPAAVGFVTVDRSRDDDALDATGEVGAIYARASVWGRGVGRQLMDVGLEELRARGCVDATLWVLDTNHRARRFYELGGWTADGAIKADRIGGADVTEVRYRLVL